MNLLEQESDIASVISNMYRKVDTIYIRQHPVQCIPPPCHTQIGSLINALQLCYLLTVKK